jgi:DNA polymerase-3 subunit epsilon
MPSIPPLSGQRSLDDLGTPLHEVTFVAVDLETTGTSPATCAITEAGAIKYRGGEVLGTFQTLVNPGADIPPMIPVLTGITNSMLYPAPRIAEVLPALLEFFGRAVLVGHNLRFDTSFLDAALTADGYERLAHRRVDTLALSRRLLHDEVPNLRLGTLARHLRVATEPNHRALADAMATAEVLHALLERTARLGVLGLDDLVELPTMRAHPSIQKLSLTAQLPRRPGVYIFRDPAGRVLYVGKATNLRTRVRSYFGGDDRKKVPQLLRETARIDHFECPDPFEAEVREIRLIQQHEPRFNRRSKAWRSYAYLKLTLRERFPRLAVVRQAKAGDGIYLGPFHSVSAAHTAREAIETAAPIRRCSQRIGRKCSVPEGATACVPAQLGTAACPCTGHTDEDEYGAIVQLVVRGLGNEPELLLDPLEARMHSLATAERFEEAALTRDRLRGRARALRRRRALESLRRSGRMTVEVDGVPRALFHGRLLVDAAAPGSLPLVSAEESATPIDPEAPCPRALPARAARRAARRRPVAGSRRLPGPASRGQRHVGVTAPTDPGLRARHPPEARPPGAMTRRRASLGIRARSPRSHP